MIELVNLFRAKVVDVSPNSLLIELAGTEEKIEKFIEVMKPYHITELARTGVIAMTRGLQMTRDVGPATVKRERSLTAPAAAALPPS